MYLTPKQEKILQDISEKTILRKLGLSEKFLREVLYSRKSALGICLIKLSTIIVILALKLCIGYKRTSNRISNILQINKEQAEWKYGYNENILNMLSKYKFEQTTWNNEIGEILVIKNTNHRLLKHNKIDYSKQNNNGLYSKIHKQYESIKQYTSNYKPHKNTQRNVTPYRVNRNELEYKNS